MIDARNRYVDSVDIQRHSIDARVAVECANRVPEPSVSYRAADDYGWDDLVRHLEHELTLAVGGGALLVDEHKRSVLGACVGGSEQSEPVRGADEREPGGAARVAVRVAALRFRRPRGRARR